MCCHLHALHVLPFACTDGDQRAGRMRVIYCTLFEGPASPAYAVTPAFPKSFVHACRAACLGPCCCSAQFARPCCMAEFARPCCLPHPLPQVGRFLADVPDGHTPAMRRVLPFMLSVSTRSPAPGTVSTRSPAPGTVSTRSPLSVSTRSPAPGTPARPGNCSSGGGGMGAEAHGLVGSVETAPETEVSAVRFLLPGLLQVWVGVGVNACVPVCACWRTCTDTHVHGGASVCVCVCTSMLVHVCVRICRQACVCV